MRKAIGIIMIILLFGGAVCGLIFGIKWKYANDTISSMYSKDEVEQIKEDIQNEWSDEKKGFLEKIENYESQIEDLSVKNEENLKQIENLTAVKSENENKIAELNEIIESNTEVINSNNEKISALNSEIERLLASESSNKSQISKLTSQVNTLQGLVEQLQITNELCSQTINLLNIHNKNLSAQINELLYQNQNHDLIVEQLNKKIDELEKSLEYYETYLDSLEDENQVVVTFEFDGSVYNVQVVEKGSKISVTTPSSTDYVIFNNWTVNGEQIDLSTYDFNQSTTVVADVTYKYDVKFMVDDEEYDSEIVTENGHATLPEAPTKAGYEFDGWTINGNTVVDVNSTTITSNTTFHAKFTKLHTVTFKYEDGIKSTQQVRDGQYATDVEIENTTYKIFNGWKVNNNIVNVEDYVIISDTEFVADLTYKYDVKFMVDDEEYDSQIVVENGFASLPEVPVKDGYEFDGWTINGSTIVDADLTTITSNTTFHAKFTKLHTVTFKYEDGIKSTQQVRDGEYATDVEIESTTYKIFNGWKVNNNIVDVEDYVIISDTEFVADVTYKYDVKFMIDDQEYNSQIIEENSFVNLPLDPNSSIENNVFVGWTINGNTIVDVASTPITSNTVFYAKFEINFSGSYSLSFDTTNYVSSLLRDTCVFEIIDQDGVLSVNLISSEKSPTVKIGDDGSSVVYNLQGIMTYSIDIKISFNRETGGYSISFSLEGLVPGDVEDYTFEKIS